jgi:hypothetical protein
MSKPIIEKAEVTLEYPDKLYIGTFAGSSRFEARFDPAGVTLILERPGADDVHKSIHMHLHYGLFADILKELSCTVNLVPKDDGMHREQLTEAVTQLHAALSNEGT